jgi:hypothetical protein
MLISRMYHAKCSQGRSNTQVSRETPDTDTLRCIMSREFLKIKKDDENE